jgi:hypothetical protein
MLGQELEPQLLGRLQFPRLAFLWVLAFLLEHLA